MKTLLATAALLTLSTTLVAAPVHAARDGVQRSGPCSGSTVWKIKASPDNGRIEVDAEIDSNRNGQTWNWTLRHNGAVAATGSSVTRAPSGSFEVVRRTNNAAGPDSFRFRATHAGEVCVARVTL